MIGSAGTGRWRCSPRDTPEHLAVADRLRLDQPAGPFWGELGQLADPDGTRSPARSGAGSLDVQRHRGAVIITVVPFQACDNVRRVGAVVAVELAYCLPSFRGRANKFPWSLAI